MKASPFVEARGVKKYFPGIRALDGVDLSIRKSEVHAIIGENGAGKSTLVKVLTGVLSPDEGEILVEGRAVRFRSVIDSRNAGIAAIQQEASMFPELTVAENIYMGHHLRRGSLGPLSWKAMHRSARELLERLELDLDTTTPVKELNTAQRHLVEIAKALSVDARMVIMDEPTSALSHRETEDLFRIVSQLREGGRAVVFISHKFDEIKRIADHFTVLRDGRFIAEGRVQDTTVDEIIRMMVGRSLSQLFPKVAVAPGEIRLSVRGLSCVGVFKDVSFEVRRGQIVGFFGLVGSGRSEVMRTLLGLDSRSGGTVVVDGRETMFNGPAEALDHGIAYVPEDRQHQGTLLPMSIRDNITLPSLRRICPVVLKADKEAALARRYSSRMEVKALTLDQAVNTLSGGNQQKVVLAKWLATEPGILILDEPTRGIDVATKAAVHGFISELAAQGLAIVLISSELPEILGMADEIMVMHEGRLVARFDRSQANAESIIRAATGSLERSA